MPRLWYAGWGDHMIRAWWHRFRFHYVMFDDFFDPKMWWCDTCKKEWGPK